MSRESKIVKSMTPKYVQLAGEMILPNNSGDHVRSIKRDTPVADADLVNKAYVDTQLTGFYLPLTGGTLSGDLKVQKTTGSIVESAATAALGEACVRLRSQTTYWDLLNLDDGVLYFKYGGVNKLWFESGTSKISDGAGNGATPAQMKTAYDHSQDNTQAHSDYLLNSQADAGVGLTLTGDNASADTAYVPMVLYNTDDTPPAASGFPIGTLYVQYTA